MINDYTQSPICNNKLWLEYNSKITLNNHETLLIS